MTEDQQTKIDNFEIESIDDFLPMPGAESIITPEESKPTIFSKPDEEDFDFLESEEKEESEKPEIVKKKEVKKALKELDEELETEEEVQVGRKKIDKSGLVETFSKLFEKGVLSPFDDDKPFEEYSIKDWEELIEANILEKEKSLREQTPKEFFESLPEELQYAAEYVFKGGNDLKGLFKVLAQVEEVRELDPSNEDHQEIIVRQYLQASNFGNGDADLIEDQIQEWLESGVITKKAAQFKPKLDQMQEEVVKSKLAQQEKFKQEQQKKKEEYMQNIYETLKPAELNGVKLDGKRQKFLWDELTTVKYESMTGRPTNLLGKLLEDYQFGQKPRYDLIAETLWLLSDPDDYKEHIKKQAKNEVTQETVRKLKTEESRKLSSTVREEPEEKQSKKIPRPSGNIFKRF